MEGFQKYSNQVISTFQYEKDANEALSDEDASVGSTRLKLPKNLHNRAGSGSVGSPGASVLSGKRGHTNANKNPLPYNDSTNINANYDVNGDNVSVNSAISGVNGDVYGMSAIGSGQVGGGASVHTAMSSVTDMHGGIGGGNFSPTMNQVPDADVKAVLKESVSESDYQVSAQSSVHGNENGNGSAQSSRRGSFKGITQQFNTSTESTPRYKSSNKVQEQWELIDRLEEGLEDENDIYILSRNYNILADLYYNEDNNAHDAIEMCLRSIACMNNINGYAPDGYIDDINKKIEMMMNSSAEQKLTTRGVEW